MAKKIKFGGIAFIVGLVLAALISIFSANNVPAWAVGLIAAIGLIVGLMNIQEGEMQMFLIASITFLISFQSLSNVLGALALGWGAVSTFFDLMSVFVAPAAAVVALMALYNLAKD